MPTMPTMPSVVHEIGLGGSVLLGALALVVYYVVSSVVTWYRLRHIPGPFLAKFSYLWLGWASRTGRMAYIYAELSPKYGPLVRVGPNEITTDDPEVVRRISGARSAYGKDTWYIGSRFNPYRDNMLTTVDAHEHDKLKARAAPAYGGRETPDLERDIDRQVTKLVDIIRTNYLWSPEKKDVPPMDMAKIVSFLTMDVISCAAFGKEIGCLEKQTDMYGFLREVRENWPRVGMAVDVPMVRNILFSPIFLSLFGPKTTDKKGLGALMGVAERFVSRRFEEGSKGKDDMLTSFIRHGFTREECEAEGLFMIIAGSDTTASTLRNTLLHIMTCPQVYRKLKEEIAQAVAQGQVSSPIRLEEAKRLPYLQAVLYEGMRMRSPAPGLYPKTVPPEGDVFHGKFIPGGTAVGSNTAALLKSTQLFGADANIFRPERFIEADAPTRAEMERLVELVFGYGRYMCAGKPVAFMELNKVYFELLRAFDLQIADPRNPWSSKSWVVFVEENMWVRFTESGSV
ncbi:pisatin demethylase [Biscogniauxia sp. FL1348]|nr:pisatin demethylase [Biscogniauxia sp. FL1348]